MEASSKIAPKDPKLNKITLLYGSLSHGIQSIQREQQNTAEEMVYAMSVQACGLSGLHFGKKELPQVMQQ